MATCSSILAWKILWTEETGELQFMGLHRVRHNSAAEYTPAHPHTHTHTHTHTHAHTQWMSHGNGVNVVLSAGPSPWMRRLDSFGDNSWL